ncbi:hypothetical protein [Chitinophaga rhizophila]|uniref:Uncharacterized protein n=1 Tax=Chitinophaga rhizophila TaxID=2866212 RepID=A0ABS7G5N7_9BACT|nr:hypothetical protein [Chitinophaga rhizophila]MBW8682791.1 hypothetical protein [Chitinophaga rhizophila]
MTTILRYNSCYLSYIEERYRTIFEMQTNTPLTTQNINSLYQLRTRRIYLIRIFFIVSIALLIGGFLLLFTGFDDDALLQSGVVLTSAAFTLGAVTIGINKKRGNYAAHPAYSSTKQILTDTLLYAELSSINTIRYQCQGHSLDLHILSAKDNRSDDMSYRRWIQDAVTLSHVPVRLSYVEYEPGTFILLEAQYPGYLHAERIVTMQPADRKYFTNKLLFRLGRMTGIATGILLFVFLVPQFETVARVFVSIAYAFFMLFFVPVTLREIITILRASDKVVIHTTITEVLGITVSTRESWKREPYYRLADGGLITFDNESFQAGDKIAIQYIVRRNGSKGLLLEVKKQ